MNKIECKLCGYVSWSASELEALYDKKCLNCGANLENILKVRDSYGREFYAEKIKIGNALFYRDVSNTLYLSRNIRELKNEKTK